MVFQFVVYTTSDKIGSPSKMCVSTPLLRLLPTPRRPGLSAALCLHETGCWSPVYNAQVPQMPFFPNLVDLFFLLAGTTCSSKLASSTLSRETSTAPT
jgi:hypothetical protein